MHILRSLNNPDLQIPLTSKHVIIGRSTDNSVVISDGSVSRQHAQIIFEAGQPILIDLNSKRGTFVNGERVQDRRLLRDGDMVVFGDQQWQYVIRTPKEKAPRESNFPSKSNLDTKTFGILGIGLIILVMISCAIFSIGLWHYLFWPDRNVVSLMSTIPPGDEPEISCNRFDLTELNAISGSTFSYPTDKLAFPTRIMRFVDCDFKSTDDYRLLVLAGPRLSEFDIHSHQVMNDPTNYDCNWDHGFFLCLAIEQDGSLGKAIGLTYGNNVMIISIIGPQTRNESELFKNILIEVLIEAANLLNNQIHMP